MSEASQNFIDLVLQKYKPSIGLEIHCQLKTKTKLFCGCPNNFGSGANSNTCPICLGYPGTLPALNQHAIELALKFGVTVGGDLNSRFRFSRKHYFYPDLPKGYQISQHQEPFCLGGKLLIDTDRYVALHHVHVEEDAGKLVHEGLWSYVDLNRAGVPLIEIVTQPEIHSALDASAVLRNVRQLARFIDVSDGNMEEGSIRCDVNISLNLIGEKKLGTKCEIKNVNSIKNVERAIYYEIVRQGDLLERSIPIVQSTMSFDAATGKTAVMRTKEDAQDYRYLDDPDLPTIQFTKAEIDAIKAHLPELPNEKLIRYRTCYALGHEEASTLVAEPEISRYFEATTQLIKGLPESTAGKQAANWVLTEVLREASHHNWDELSAKIPPEKLAKLIVLSQTGKISVLTAKAIFKEVVNSGIDPELMIQNQGLLQIDDQGAVHKIIDDVIARSPSEVAQYVGGKLKIYQYFVGETMKAGKGKLNPKQVNEILKSKLDQLKSNGEN